MTCHSAMTCVVAVVGDFGGCWLDGSTTLFIAASCRPDGHGAHQQGQVWFSL